jgi:hypothetical protein
MSQQNKTTLQSAINTQIADNTSGDISAADIRDNLINITDSLVFNTGSQAITGSLTVNGGITGSLLGTASFAANATPPFNSFQYNIFTGGDQAVPESGNVFIWYSEGAYNSLRINKTTLNGLDISQYLTSRLNNTAVLINIPSLNPQNAILVLAGATDNGSYLTFGVTSDNSIGRDLSLYTGGVGTITFIP